MTTFNKFLILIPHKYSTAAYKTLYNTSNFNCIITIFKSIYWNNLLNHDRRYKRHRCVCAKRALSSIGMCVVDVSSQKIIHMLPLCFRCHSISWSAMESSILNAVSIVLHFRGSYRREWLATRVFFALFSSLFTLQSFVTVLSACLRKLFDSILQKHETV